MQPDAKFEETEGQLAVGQRCLIEFCTMKREFCVSPVSATSPATPADYLRKASGLIGVQPDIYFYFLCSQCEFCSNELTTYA
mmetsp:Transcript_52415/g.71557  ORF Transcript_52415/g.71557 Transcript_52415/m.71557 type:complete len:82 (-) Transcript_52415:689-934(-)